MPHTQATLSRVEHVDAVADALKDYDVDDRIEMAQLTMEFEEGIKVANEVAAEFLADLHLLMDYHGQDFDAILLASQAKYDALQEVANG